MEARLRLSPRVRCRRSEGCLIAVLPISRGARQHQNGAGDYPGVAQKSGKISNVIHAVTAGTPGCDNPGVETERRFGLDRFGRICG